MFSATLLLMFQLVGGSGCTRCLATWVAVLLAPLCAASPATVSTFSSGMREQGLGNFLVVPERKLLFCMIQKVGCSTFQDLFRFARSSYDPSQLNPKYKYSANTPQHHHLTPEDLNSILLDKSWHKAVFVRDPLERFASAYSSKCVRGQGDVDGPKVCTSQFGVANLSFQSAVASIASFDATTGSDKADEVFSNQFKSQAYFCGGLTNTLHHYNTVQVLAEDGSNREKVAAMLQRVSLRPKDIPYFDALFPPKALFKAPAMPKSAADLMNWHKHETETAIDISSVYPADEPWLGDIVARHYAQDYTLFANRGLSIPAAAARVLGHVGSSALVKSGSSKKSVRRRKSSRTARADTHKNSRSTRRGTNSHSGSLASF